MNRRKLNNHRHVWATLVSLFGEKCCYCHSQIATQIDHIIPYSYSKYHGIENLRPACSWCNLLASDAVFETFEEKYEYLQEKRQKRIRKDKPLVCSQCLIPYYSAMHSNPLLCPRCTDLDGGSKCTDRKTWKDWIQLLDKAGMDYKAHFDLADRIITEELKSISLKTKVAILVESSKSYKSVKDVLI